MEPITIIFITVLSTKYLTKIPDIHVMLSHYLGTKNLINDDESPLNALIYNNVLTETEKSEIKTMLENAFDTDNVYVIYVEADNEKIEAIENETLSFI